MQSCAYEIKDWQCHSNAFELSDPDVFEIPDLDNDRNQEPFRDGTLNSQLQYYTVQHRIAFENSICFLDKYRYAVCITFKNLFFHPVDLLDEFEKPVYIYELCGQ
eukprot:TRINITY_DN15045_c0_g1_i2.p2 TRINITY_DN15045_c0_g1~~TRINITY_DN15045_c0_g1_i2.p2  ORF type:complete len:105 (+),score=12.14 TRINITY_DN15045_c0_g1_i2:448-762(+)